MIETGSPQAGQAGERGSRRRYLLVLLIFLPFLILAIVHLKILLQTIFVRNETTFPEGVSVYAFLMALRTGKLYSSPLDFPFNPQVYGPVFYLVGVCFAKVAHGDPMLTTELCRLLSFLSFIGSAGIVGYLSWKLERKRRWAAVSIVLGLACVWAWPWAATVRPDALSIFLILAALAVYQTAQGRSRLFFWAGVLGTLSCLTKQSTAPVLLALLVDSLIARRFRNTAALIAGCVTVPAIILSALWLRIDPFLTNSLILRHSLYDWPAGIVVLINSMRTDQMAIIPVSMALLGVGLSWRKDEYRAIMLAAGLGCVSNLAALARAGGDQNYLILPWMLAVLLVPAGLAGIEVWARRSVLIPLGLTLIGGLLLTHQRNVLLPKLQADLDTTNLNKLKMLSDNSYLELRSRQPQLLDPYYYHQLSMLNVWSIAPIIRQIDGEEYDLILIAGSDGPTDSEFLISFRGTSGWGADTLSSMVSHYRALCEIQGFLALAPRDRPGGAKEEDIARIFGQPCRATGRTPQVAPGMR
jgi:hypothetical protein